MLQYEAFLLLLDAVFFCSIYVLYLMLVEQQRNYWYPKVQETTPFASEAKTQAMVR